MLPAPFFYLRRRLPSFQEHLAATKGLTHADMDRLEAELARLRKHKAEKLTDMLKVSREDIRKLLEVGGGSGTRVTRHTLGCSGVQRCTLLSPQVCFADQS